MLKCIDIDVHQCLFHDLAIAHVHTYVYTVLITLVGIVIVCEAMVQYPKEQSYQFSESDKQNVSCKWNRFKHRLCTLVSNFQHKDFSMIQF